MSGWFHRKSLFHRKRTGNGKGEKKIEGSIGRPLQPPGQKSSHYLLILPTPWAAYLSLDHCTSPSNIMPQFCPCFSTWTHVLEHALCMWIGPLTFSDSSTTPFSHPKFYFWFLLPPPLQYSSQAPLYQPGAALHILRLPALYQPWNHDLENTSTAQESGKYSPYFIDEETDIQGS